MSDRYAVIGNPIGFTKSPFIHGAFARKTGQDLIYEAIEGPIGGFSQRVDQFRAEGAGPAWLEHHLLARERVCEGSGTIGQVSLAISAAHKPARTDSSTMTRYGSGSGCCSRRQQVFDLIGRQYLGLFACHSSRTRCDTSLTIGGGKRKAPRNQSGFAVELTRSRELVFDARCAV